MKREIYFLLLLILLVGCKESKLDEPRTLFANKSYSESRIAYHAVATKAIFYGEKFKSLLGLAWASYQEANYKQTIEICNKLQNEYQQTRLDDWIILLRGFALFARSDYRLASESFHKVTLFTKTLFMEDAVFMEARCQEKSGEYDKAVDNYKLFLKKYHTPIYYRDAFIGLWCSLDMLGKKEETYEVLNAYVKNFKDASLDPALDYKLGKLAEELNRQEESIEHYKEFLSRSEKNDTVAEVLYYLGKTYESHNMDKTAFENYLLLLRMFPDTVKRNELHLWCAKYLAKQKDYKESLKHIEYVYNNPLSDDDYEKSVYYRANIFDILGDVNHAMLDYAEYLTAAPEGEYYEQAKKRIQEFQSR